MEPLTWSMRSKRPEVLGTELLVAKTHLGYIPELVFQTRLSDRKPSDHLTPRDLVISLNHNTKQTFD